MAAPRAQPAIQLDGISHVAVNVTDMDAAREFYCAVLGFSFERDLALPGCGPHAVLRAASSQRVALCRDEAWKPLSDSGVHTAYRVTPEAHDGILERLARQGVTVFSYREVRPAEAEDACYFHDPAGNRIQLVRVAGQNAGAGARGAGIAGIDHAAVQAIDLEWEEDFYLGRLGLPVECLVGWRTEDYVLARRWKNGEVDMAPGTMRLDKRYSTIHGTDPVPRPNMQMFVRTGGEAFGIYLASKDFQLPPEEPIIGTPRVAFRVPGEALPAIAARLETTGRAVVGPIRHPTPSPLRSSLYCRDPGGNFIEFCA